MDTTLPGTVAPPSPAPGVAGPAPHGPPPALAAGNDAALAAQSFGGLRGGRPRKDGLTPGSPEAREADRKKDRERKAKDRLPPPLPGSDALGVDSRPPLGNGQANLPGLVDGAPAAPVVLWKGESLKPIFEQLLPTIEDLAVRQIKKKAALVRLPGVGIAEIEKEAEWPAPAKKALIISAPEVAAKWLNKTGISAEYQPEVLLLGALSTILASHTLLLKRLDELAANANVQPAKPEKTEEKKP